MAKLLIVEKDAVHGTDQHFVSGNGTNPAPPPPIVPYVWLADYAYTGAMTDELSDFVRIAGMPVALTTSRSSLKLRQDVSPTGGHSGPTGSKFRLPIPVPVPVPVPVPILSTLKIIGPIGVGRPSVGAGSGFVSVDGRPVLLDGDKIDTCDGLGRLSNSRVTSSRQSFVRASG